MLAAAFLYNVTGDTSYEDVIAKESVCTTSTSEIDKKDEYCQYWGTAAYLMCAKQNLHPIHHPELLANMKASVIHEAMTKNAGETEKRPSRRATDDRYGWYESIEEVQALCIAHVFATEQADKDTLLKAMILEADYGLGRNPLNMVQMTMLGSRHADDIYTTGRNDGVPGVHPGHTPYMNAIAWGKGFMADPQWYASKGYPEWKQWPYGEALWHARYCYCNNEFTPQQTMRGKMCLLGYLYSLGQPNVAH
jgi:endoglucanase